MRKGRNDDLSLLKWQWKLMSLLPVGPNARGKSVEELCKEMREIETGDKGPANCRDDNTGKALIKRIQKSLNAISLDMELGSEIVIQVKDGENYVPKHPYDTATRGRYWKWKGGKNRFMLPPQSADEALALLLVEERLKEELPPAISKCMETYFKSARETIAKFGPGNNYVRWQRKIAHVPPNQPLKTARIRPEVYEQVLRALYEDEQLRISYRKRGSEIPEKHRAHPLGMLLRGPVTYLVCTLNDHTNPVMLALHRIQWAKAEGSRANIPKGFTLQDYIVKGGGEFSLGEAASGQLIALEADFASEVGQHLEETPLHKEQSLTRIDDGRWRLTAEVRETQQLRWWLLAFGPRVEVIAPAHLREWVAKEHQSAARLYQRR